MILLNINFWCCPCFCSIYEEKVYFEKSKTWYL